MSKFHYSYPPVIMIVYPHMGVKESQIWTLFLRNIGWSDIERIDYAVRVGPATVPSDITEENIRRMAEAITKLRIDAVVHRKSEIWLMEVKEIANLVAIGQVLSYQHYYINEYKPLKPVYLGIVAQDYKRNIVDVCKRYGIRIFIVRTDQVIIL